MYILYAVLGLCASFDIRVLIVKQGNRDFDNLKEAIEVLELENSRFVVFEAERFSPSRAESLNPHLIIDATEDFEC